MAQLILISALCACLISACLVPAIRAIFRRLGLVDRPDRERKLHLGAVSLGGGLAVFLSVGITLAVIAGGDRVLGGRFLPAATIAPLHTSASSADAALPRAGTVAQDRQRNQWYLLLAAAGVLMLVGLVDDTVALRGRQKLLLQILVVAALVAGGTLVQSFQWFGHVIELGIFAYPVTLLWLLAAINALNLIDGADGMASTAGAILSLALAVLCVQNGNFIGGAVAAALAGSLLGFLLYNRPPATIYLGDAGSMVIGLMLGVISIWSSVQGSALVTFAPLLVLAVPLFDSFIAIVRRLLTGRGIFAADRAHLHHRLLDRFSHGVMLVVVAGLCGISALAAILSVHWDQQWLALGGAMVVLGLLVCTGCFGGAELRMLVSRSSHFGESLLARDQSCDTLFHQRSIRLQGDHCWDAIWISLVDFASDHGLVQVKLNVAIAWMQQGYHGSWRRVRMPDKVDQVYMKMPLFLDGRPIGRLEVIGDARAAAITSTLQATLQHSEDLQVQIQLLVCSDEIASWQVADAAAAEELVGSGKLALSSS
jgi:UDP-GlcNAc:undecaprenyl-phosphate/decaprenyl-phosphate GlcNAc-1-phosphate transferase